MKIKGKRQMTLSEAGGLLKKLGEELLKTGKISYPKGFGNEFEIQPPDNLNVEVEYKEKKGKKKFEVEFEWYEGSAMKDVSKAEKPLEFKELKKGLKHVFYDVEVALKSEDIRGAKENFEKFTKLNDKFKAESELDWEKDVMGMDRILEKLEGFIKFGDLDNSLFQVDRLWKYKKTCHAKFKD